VSTPFWHFCCIYFWAFFADKRLNSCGMAGAGLRGVFSGARPGRKTEFVEACDFMGYQRFLYIGP
jgi:hypothetical protein